MKITCFRCCYHLQGHYYSVRRIDNLARVGVTVSQFPPFHYFPRFSFCQNTGYILNIKFIPSRCDRSWAAITPVRFERDWTDLTGIFAESKSSLTDKFMIGVFLWTDFWHHHVGFIISILFLFDMHQFERLCNNSLFPGFGLCMGWYDDVIWSVMQLYLYYVELIWIVWNYKHGFFVIVVILLTTICYINMHRQRTYWPPEDDRQLSLVNLSPLEKRS